MKLHLRLFLLILIWVSPLYCENSATDRVVFKARCKSRCLAKQETETFRNTTTIPDECTRQSCFACMKPCQELEKKKGLSACRFLCGSFVQMESQNVCQESCKFVKHLYLDGTYHNNSCPNGEAKSKCILMRPENVSAVHGTKKESGKFTVSWNGTWPLNTVFVLMSRWHKKGTFQDSLQGWEEIKQTSLQSVTVDVQPLLWHQFKVLAANQYAVSHFSVPSKMEFLDLKRIHVRPPRDFHVISLKTIKGLAEVQVSWKKPDNIYGLSIHRYKLSWSMRPDIHLDQFENFHVKDQRIEGNVHQYTISELQPNRTYFLELQAVICQQKRRNIRSSRVTLTIRTPALATDNIKKRRKPKKKTEMTKNSISAKKVKSILASTPTILRQNLTSTVSSYPSQATTPGRRPEEKARRNHAGLIKVLGLKMNVLIALAVIIMCNL